MSLAQARLQRLQFLGRIVRKEVRHLQQTDRRLFAEQPVDQAGVDPLPPCQQRKDIPGALRNAELFPPDQVLPKSSAASQPRWILRIAAS